MRLPGMLVGVLGLSLLVGCGGSSTRSESLVPVSGVVKVNGRPLDGVRMAFHPTGENKSLGGCWAVTDSSGSFTVTHVSKEEGIPEGEYHVTFSRFVKDDGSALGPDESPTMTRASESIAPLWSDVSKVGNHNKIQVPASGTDSLSFSVSTAPLKKKT